MSTLYTPADFFVSIVIPCYNYGRFLNDAVGSVLQQTFPHWEIIIVNDGSTDNSAEISKVLVQQNPNVKIRLLDKPNMGLSDARNQGIELAEGSWILPLDADDMFEKTYLEAAFKKIQKEPQINLVSSAMQEFEAKNGFWDPAEFSIDTLKKENCFPYSSIYKKELWRRSNGYENALPWAGEDLSLWYDFAKLGIKVGRIEERMLLYRVHQNGSMYTKLMQHWPEVEAMIHTLHPEIFTAQELLVAHEKISAMSDDTYQQLFKKTQKFPDLYAAVFWQAIYQEKRGNIEKALELYEYSTRLHFRPDWQIMWRQILCNITLGNMPLALRTSQELLSLFPEHQWVNQAYAAIKNSEVGK